jgi:hypothetical protein
VESSMLQEREEENEIGALHPKNRSEKRKVISLLSLHFFRVCVFFLSCLRRRRCHCFLLSCFCFLPTSPPSYLPPALIFFFALLLQRKRPRQQAIIAFSLCLKRRKRRWQLDLLF